MRLLSVTRWAGRTVFVAVLSAGLARPVHGQAPPTTGDPAVHFQRGVDALKAGNRATALAEFSNAQTLAPAATTLWNIAVLELEMNLLPEAHRDFEAYRDEMASRVAPDRAQMLAATLTDLERKLGRIRVVVSPADASVWIDDVPARGPMWLSPGDHMVRARAPGHSEG